MLNKAVINLETLRNNAKSVKRKLTDGVKFNAVVKADGYGHGAAKVANALYGLVDSFSVALVEEGVTLRLSGIDKDILVLIPPRAEEIAVAVYNRFIITVDSVFMVDAIEMECAKQNRSARVDIKFNSGMNRFGVKSLEELKAVLERIKGSKRVNLHGAFSHLAEPQNKNSLKTAQNKFLLANNLVKGYNSNAVCHISASGGFLVGCKSDMVRIGLLLYGYKPFESDSVSVKPIMKVYAPIVSNFHLNKGESALYGKCPAKKEVDLALVRYGYADGLFRKNSDGLFNNRCMDTSCYLTKGGRADYAVVMDNADLIAKENGTISYEVLTKCALRAEKIYLN
ncbi:MAG: alanine racemase [Clostridia bacterium]|nr:alanine racemase [Clostridia bacterium]